MPGNESQIDFGAGAPVVRPDGKRKHPHVFRIVLSFSRKGYSEAVYHQSTDNFIHCLENAFWHFGGASRTLIIDNLKIAVKNADWYDPDIHPKIQSFCEHYGTVILPTKPYTPRHKGKVERGIGYVKGNALKGHKFCSLAVAYKQFDKQLFINITDEMDMIFVGLITFFDPPKTGVADTIGRLKQIGISLKVITGDNSQVAA
jgi:hypothetical protein